MLSTIPSKVILRNRNDQPPAAKANTTFVAHVIIFLQSFQKNLKGASETSYDQLFSFLNDPFAPQDPES
jgi:hypothetical protein